MINAESHRMFFDQGFDRQEFINERFENVKSFFARRGLSFADAFDMVKDHYKEGDLLLLTSSPVHGLATAKSDIDFILVTGREDEEVSARTPLTMYMGQTRLDLYRFYEDNVKAILEKFDRVSRSPVKNMMKSLSDWDTIFPSVSPKVFERLINGITFDSQMPYIGHLKQLSYVWTVKSYLKTVRFNIYAQISVKGGRVHSAAGYLLNGVLSLMNSLMSWHGFVYSNKKHYLAGWKKFREIVGLPQVKEIAGQVDECFTLITEGLSQITPEKISRAAARFNQLQNAVADYLRIDFLKDVKIKQVSDFAAHQILMDLYLVEGNKARCFFRNDVRFIDVERIEPKEISNSDLPCAGEILDLLRMGVYAITISG